MSCPKAEASQAGAHELFRQRLDRNFTSEFGVTCTPHFTHSTLPQEAQDFVVAEFGAGFHEFRTQLMELRKSG